MDIREIDRKIKALDKADDKLQGEEFPVIKWDIMFNRQRRKDLLCEKDKILLARNKKALDIAVSEATGCGDKNGMLCDICKKTRDEYLKKAEKIIKKATK